VGGSADSLSTRPILVCDPLNRVQDDSHAARRQISSRIIARAHRSPDSVFIALPDSLVAARCLSVEQFHSSVDTPPFARNDPTHAHS
jgi:hypothetical protein